MEGVGGYVQDAEGGRDKNSRESCVVSRGGSGALGGVYEGSCWEILITAE